jgi:putative transposase
LEDNKLKIGKGIYKFAKSRDMGGTLKRLTVKRDACGDLFVFFTVDSEEEVPIRVETGHTAGLDFGLKTFLTGSDGTRYEAPQPLKASLAELKAANRALSRKKTGSNNRAKAKLKLAKLHRKIRQQREAWHWQLARELCLKYDRIYIEDLLLTGMMRRWGRKMADLGHGGFLRILAYVATKLGTVLKKIDRFFPSSKLCHVCGYKHTALQLSERLWTCDSCQTVHDRDANAAINIHQEGHSSCRVGEIRPALLALAV